MPLAILERMTASEYFWRGRFIDLWSIPHLISGIYIAYITVFYFSLSRREGFRIALMLGVGWEVFERLTGISKTEKYANSLSDIVVAQMGYVFGVWIWMNVVQSRRRLILAAGLGLLYILIALLGFAAFKFYGH